MTRVYSHVRKPPYEDTAKIQDELTLSLHISNRESVGFQYGDAIDLICRCTSMYMLYMYISVYVYV